jgi:transcriptional regulator with XRE-family HTH domain
MRDHNIDQPRLAALAGLSQSSISRYLDGRRRPEPTSMEGVASALGIPPDYFLEYRRWKIQEIMTERPELVSSVYDRLVALVARTKRTETPGAKRS